jgi:glutamate synthase (NADPH/NADH) large chain
VGRTDLLAQVSRGGPHLDDLDLNPLLVRVEKDPLAPVTPYDEINKVADTLDAEIVRDAAPLLRGGEKLHLSYVVKNTHRAVGTFTSHAIYQAHGKELPVDHLSVTLKGSAGQSLGAFGMKGLWLEVIGEANDYVGKGLSGAIISIRGNRPIRGQALAGNTILYGATSGALYIAGTVGERFAVRNSGALAVIEGAGAHACEYMTGGEVVILGFIGQNFGAGMTGGRAYLFDPEAHFKSCLNQEGLLVLKPSPTRLLRIKAMVEEHQRRTRSALASEILDDWEGSQKHFHEIVPEEIWKLEKAALTSAG